MLETPYVPFWAASPEGLCPVEYRGYFVCTYIVHTSVAPWAPRPGSPGQAGQGPQTLSWKPWLGSPSLETLEASRLWLPSQGFQDRVSRAGPPGQHLEGRAPSQSLQVKGNRQDGWMKGWTKYFTGHCPSGAAALLTIRKSGIKKEKQVEGTADHILTLVDWLVV